MATEPAPAIRAELDGRYSDIEPIKTIGSDTRFYRGLGEVGTTVELVDASAIDGCPRCGEDEMVLSKHVGPESVDGAFYCTNVACPHFVQDAVESEMDKIRANTPEVWDSENPEDSPQASDRRSSDNTAICPECETRFTTQLKQGLHRNHRYIEGNPDDGGIVGDFGDLRSPDRESEIPEVMCDECSPSYPEVGL